MLGETYQNEGISDQTSLPNSHRTSTASDVIAESLRRRSRELQQRLIVFLEPPSILVATFAFASTKFKLYIYPPLLFVTAMTRKQQIVYPGLGKNYMSPERPGRRVKSQLVSWPGQQSKREQILKRIRELDKKAQKVSSVPPECIPDIFDTPAADSEMDWEDDPAESHHDPPMDEPKRRKPRNHQANTLNQYKAWKEIVSSLVEPLLSYIGRTTAGVTPQVVVIPQCSHCDGSKT